MNEMVVLSTADSPELASKLAKALVEAKAAACVNIVAGIHSIYRWKGEICEDKEWLLLIKSTQDCLERIRSVIRDLHTYDVPEVVVISVSGGDPDYLQWLAGQVKPD